MQDADGAERRILLVQLVRLWVEYEMSDDLIEKAAIMRNCREIQERDHRAWQEIRDQNRRLKEQLATENSLNNDLMANCNQLRDRCWKAESELDRWQKIAIDEKAALLSFAAMISPPMPDELIEFYMKKAKENKDKKRSIAAKELDLQLLQPDDNLTIAYMLGGKKADERREVLQGYVARLEKAYLADSMQSEELARGALNKIREGKP
jgi:seryl-tRNA synthetase